MSDPYLVVEQCGTLRNEPVYIINKHTPEKGNYPAKIVSIRCMDLGKEALGNYKAEEGGCSTNQFVDAISDLRCAKCGMEFSKYLMRQEPYIHIKGLP
ncbi:hypothetical protein PNOK_0078600 [Pyrrhoderma noxium]|uniref:Uncharacterized protein n=1 Tax=Pyrrhoderma noxium TaxID=2282107 RepID=A0A286UVX0_9AGAM|nr:hypothetical protein PNOK_0078600 [Pyrrhoderma noxium]